MECNYIIQANLVTYCIVSRILVHTVIIAVNSLNFTLIGCAYIPAQI